jgi:hypothetical protein
MNKLLLIRLILILFPFSAFSQETQVQLTEKISVTFPEKPLMRDMQGVSVQHYVRLADSTANFIASATNLEKSSGMTSDLLQAAQQQDEFWEQAQKGFVAQLGTDATVVSSELKEISGKKVLHFVTSAMRNGAKVEITVYMFFDGIYTINIIHQKRSEEASVEAKNKYFASLQIGVR